MSYNLTLTNGSSLATLADGTADTSSYSISLVGRNFAGYGLYINENFIKLLENFSNSSEPTNPLVGQLWWDSDSRHLSVWQGTGKGWKVISSSLTGSAPPLNPVTGDFWWNTASTQFSVYNGSQWVSIGPYIAPGAAVTNILGNIISDGSALHTIGNILVNNKLVGSISSDSTPFNPVGSPFTVINPGINLLTHLTVNGNVSASNVITTTANISNINVTSNAVFSGNVVFKGPVLLPTTDNQTFNSNVVPSANLTYNLGSPTVWWNNIYGTSIHAQYADLAERFETDVEYSPGTVVELGGVAEITAAVEELSEDVFGVISSKAAFVMNGTAGTDKTHPPVAVQGRVPVKVIGKIKKGDRLVSAGNGLARAGTRTEINTWNVIGRSLEQKTTDGEGVIEAVVKLNS